MHSLELDELKLKYGFRSSAESSLPVAIFPNEEYGSCKTVGITLKKYFLHYNLIKSESVIHLLFNLMASVILPLFSLYQSLKVTNVTFCCLF